MKLVIDIPEEMHEQIMNGYVPLGISKYLKNGTPLPKGHGRLIDADALYEYVADKYSEGEQLAIDITDAPTIIEADKGESEEV